MNWFSTASQPLYLSPIADPRG